MIFELMKLPYEQDALEPYIFSETLKYHHGKHHQTYVDNLNKIVEENPEYQHMILTDIIIKAPAGPIFNNSAQIWNHDFYFEALTPEIDQVPNKELLSLIHVKWGSFDQFKAEFNKMALGNFGSGWTWLIMESDGLLEIMNTQNAMTPIANKEKVIKPLLTCDVWEHAYYIDYRNRRSEYLENFWRIVNWRKVEERFN